MSACTPGSSTQLRILLFIFLSVLTHTVRAQQAADVFWPLSSTAYTSKIKELHARKIPATYSDRKQQQAYEQIEKERNAAVESDFENNRLVDDSVLLGVCNRIIHRIYPKNFHFPEDSIHVYINRSLVANACCHGEGTLYVNLGLFLWVDNEDELALVLAHELSHQLLGHLESMIQKQIALVSSDDFINELRDIKHSSDLKYERYKALMKNLTVQNGKHSRFKESEADSLGVILIRNAGYDVSKAALVLLKLDKVDDIFSASKLYDLRALFAKYHADENLPAAQKKYHGLSEVTMTMNADKDFDSVKTHPDCPQRYTVSSGGLKPVPVACCSAIAPWYLNYKTEAMRELVRYEMESGHFTVCSHLCLFAINNGFTDPYYTDVLSVCFSGMVSAGKHLERFSVTDAGGEKGSNLKELQDAIFAANNEKLSAVALAFLSADGGHSDDAGFAKMIYDVGVKDADETAARTAFLAQYPNSKYKYLFNPKTTLK